MEEIKNKVAESGLIQLDLAMFNPKVTIQTIDLSDQLWQGLVIKEKDFREWIKVHNWTNYTNGYAVITCSVDAIIPTWAYMLVSVELTRVACSHLVGHKIDLERELIRQQIEGYDCTPLEDQRVIIKGCSDIADPAYAMTELIKRIQPIVKSIMYGEPCSTVPVYKRR